ncbi:hypothetical protein VNO77_03505 [Canavalia gladiata]|uniref:Uncharacterized protein n=1 Tax=Canavalia gladiata TaxID=3824 RepID=A0AAN9MVN0_CANGL
MGIFNVMAGLVLASERVMDDNARSTPTTLISTPNWLLGSLDGTTWVGKDQLVSRLIQLLLSAFIMGCCFAQLPSCHISREVYPIQIASVSLRSILNSQPSMERLDLHRYLPLIENFPSVFPNLDLNKTAFKHHLCIHMESRSCIIKDHGSGFIIGYSSDAHIKVNQDSLFIEYYIETNLNREFHTRKDSSYGIVLFKNKECVAKG